MKIHHINCGILHKPPAPKASCHCLLIADQKELLLIDTGIGLKDVENPEERVGKEMIESVGFQFHKTLTAAHQVEELGYAIADVKHIVLSHMDNDHTGGLADFPQAKIHVSDEEYKAFCKGSFRYYKSHLQHKPDLELYSPSSSQWFGFEARKLDLPVSEEMYLIPLFGHTSGHCGVAIKNDDKWLFYIGDAYYLRAELEVENHPVDQLASLNAMHDPKRRETLNQLRKLMHNHADEIDIFGYHDIIEFEQFLNK